MGCASGLAKYVLFFFNLICALAGLALLIIGVLYKLNITEITDAIPDEYSAVKYIPILLIVVGSIVFVIAFFGCCGAVKESTCMLTTYAVILLIIFVLQVALGVVAFLQIKDDSDLQNQLTASFKKSFDEYTTNKAAAEVVDGIQQGLRCCGVKTSLDWTLAGRPFPPSCCDGNTSPCLLPFGNGCASKLYDTTREVAKVIGIVVISIAAVEVVGAIFALCLSSSIKNQQRRGAYA